MTDLSREALTELKSIKSLLMAMQKDLDWFRQREQRKIDHMQKAADDLGAVAAGMARLRTP